MAKLKFNSAGVAGARKHATSAKNTSTSVKDGVASIQKNMQSCVTGRSNISSRLTNVKTKLTQIESGIAAIYQMTDNASTKYINTENNVVRLGQAVAQSAKISTSNGNNKGAFTPVTVDKTKTNTPKTKENGTKWGDVILDNGLELFKKLVGKVGFVGGAASVVVDFAKGANDKSNYKMGKATVSGVKSFTTLIGDLASNAYKPASQQDWKKAFIGDWSTHSLLKNLSESAKPVERIQTGAAKWWDAIKKETSSYSMKNASTVGDKIKVGTKWAGVALSAVSNGIGNVEEHGELNGRAIAETIGETVADVAIGAVATATVVGAAAAIGVSAPAVVVGAVSVGVVWVADKIVKAATGKRSTSEWISDSVLDLGETVIDGAKSVLNEVGNSIKNIGIKWKLCFC